MSTTTIIPVRWLIRRDMPDVLEIDRESFDEWWTEHEFTEHIKQRNCIGNVAERDGKILGYMLYELCKDKLVIIRLAVHPKYRRQGIGRSLLNRVRAKLSDQRRHEAWFEVPEERLGAQLWLRACGWRWKETLKSAACEGDWYRFVVEVE